MDQELLKFAISQGLFAALFVWLLIDTNNTNPLVNISWRKDEDIYNFYFNNCTLPTNYIFCPSNKTNWIKQIIQ